MDRENTNTLWSQTQKEEKRSKGAGVKYWNNWAKGLLKEKDKLEKNGEWCTASKVSFEDHSFEDDTDFAGFIFPHMVNFRDCVFKKCISFSGSTFGGPVDFNGAKFHHDVFFQEAIFNDRTQFNRVSFSGFAIFYKAEFRGHASFESARFDGSLYLPDAKFINEVPDFLQARFRGPLRLDNVKVKKPKFFLFKGDIDTAARYRALKKMAIESQDHKREMDFFAGELKERRGSDDAIYHTSYWFGLFYGIFSNFGRSAGVPFTWLITSLLGFGYYYYQCSVDIFSVYRTSLWDVEWFCESLYLSLLNSLPIIGYGAGGRDRTLRYLFGAPEDMSFRLDALFILQNLLSAVLIFLFLLALRNHFKIK